MIRSAIISLRLLSILTTTALILSVSSVRAATEEWPQWRGPKGDSIVRAEGLLPKWPEGGPKKVWDARVGLGYSSPIGFEGKVYMFSTEGNKETLTAFNAADGKVAWSEAYAIDRNPDYPGTRASPTIDGKIIYTYGATGVLCARNLADGKEVWQINVLKETGAEMLTWGQASSPTINGDHLYVQGGKGGSLAVAVDKTTGKFVWKGANALGGYASVIVCDFAGGKQVLAVFGGDAIHGVDPKTGKTLWSVPWKTSYDVNAANPIFQDGYLFVSSGYNHGCMMLQITPVGGKKLWENKNIQCKFQPPILDKGFLYANSEDKRGTVKCIKWPSGEIKWEAKEPKLGFGGSILRVGADRLITLSQDGKLGLMLATPDKNEPISSVELLRGFDQNWATPLVYQGKLYAKGKDQLVCVDISGK